MHDEESTTPDGGTAPEPQSAHVAPAVPGEASDAEPPADRATPKRPDLIRTLSAVVAGVILGGAVGAGIAVAAVPEPEPVIQIVTVADEAALQECREIISLLREAGLAAVQATQAAMSSGQSDISTAESIVYLLKVKDLQDQGMALVEVANQKKC